MIEKRNEICPACFRGKMLNGLCPYCGFIDHDSSGEQNSLPWYSILNGAYQTGRVLGVGGFGITYAARSLVSGIRCCIKEHVPDSLVSGRDKSGRLIVPGEYREEFERGRNRFLDEARILKQLQDNVTVVNILDFFEQNGTAYFVMEYLDGDNMRVFQQKHTDRREELTKRALQMLLSVGSALMEVHRFGLIHGDISPENIILTKTGEMKLIDFGAARTFQDGSEIRQGRIFLKSGYAPYEQHTVRGRIGPWTDIYSLAATYYALVTGRKIPDARERIKEDRYQPLGVMCKDLDASLTRVIDRALAVDYRERYQSMREFLDAISQNLPRQEVRKRQRATASVVYLEMYTGNGAMHSWALQDNVEYTVGRHPSNRILLPPDERLSRSHCTIRYVGSRGYILLRDCSSRGIYLERSGRLPKNEESRIRLGEYFYMAVPEFRFRVVEDEAWKTGSS